MGSKGRDRLSATSSSRLHSGSSNWCAPARQHQGSSHSFLLSSHCCCGHAAAAGHHQATNHLLHACRAESGSSPPGTRRFASWRWPQPPPHPPPGRPPGSAPCRCAGESRAGAESASEQADYAQAKCSRCAARRARRMHDPAAGLSLMPACLPLRSKAADLSAAHRRLR